MHASTKSPPKRKFRPIRLNLEEEMRFLNSLTEENIEDDSKRLSCEESRTRFSDESRSRSSDESQTRSSDESQSRLSGENKTTVGNKSILASNKTNAPEIKNCFNNNPKGLINDENKVASSSLSLISYQTPKNKQTSQFYTPTLKSIKESGGRDSKPKIQFRTHISSYLKSTPISSDMLKRSEPKLEITPKVPKPVIMGPPNSIHKNKENDSSEFNVVNKPVKTLIVKNTEYIVLKELGRGGSSVIYNCYDSKTYQEFAIKCVNLNQDSSVTAGFINEVNLLHKLRECDRIIKIFSYQLLENERKLYVILEKGERDLSKILSETSRKTQHFPMYLITYYWMEMLQAVKQIHSFGVIHSDLKPANFVQANGRIKLIDFGIASSVQNDMTSVVKNIALGTFSYISPEALCSQKSTNLNSPNYGKSKFKISYKSDVWSLGCILYQLVYRRTPFQHIAHTAAKLLIIMDPKHVIEYPEAPWVKPEILKTIQSCLRYNMRERPSIDELISENFS